MDLSVRPALHMYLWLQVFISKKKPHFIHVLSFSYIMILLQQGGPANLGAHVTGCTSLVVERKEVRDFGVSLKAGGSMRRATYTTACKELLPFDKF